MKFKLRTSREYDLSGCTYTLNELKQKKNGINEFKIDIPTATIEIDSLEELIEFCDQHRRIVFETKEPIIEIYNDYRE